MNSNQKASGKKISGNLPIILIILIILLLYAGISNKNRSTKEIPLSPSPSLSPKIINIALLICMDERNPYLDKMAKGAKDSASRRNAAITVLYANDDAALQIKQIKSVSAMQIDAILLNPVSDEVIPAVKEAMEAGVPVITVDRSLSDCRVICNITSDNISGGEMAAEYLSYILRQKGKIVELEGTPDSSAAIDRGKGFSKKIALYPNIQIIARATGNFNRSDARTVFSGILKKHPNIDGVFAHNDQMILGAIDAAKEAGRDKEILFMGFDGTSDAIEAIDNCNLAGTVAQKPDEIGRLGVETAVKHIRGEAVPDTINVGLALIIK